MAIAADHISTMAARTKTSHPSSRTHRASSVHVAAQRCASPARRRGRIRATGRSVLIHRFVPTWVLLRIDHAGQLADEGWWSAVPMSAMLGEVRRAEHSPTGQVGAGALEVVQHAPVPQVRWSPSPLRRVRTSRTTRPSTSSVSRACSPGTPNPPSGRRGSQFPVGERDHPPAIVDKLPAPGRRGHPHLLERRSVMEEPGRCFPPATGSRCRTPRGRPDTNARSAPGSVSSADTVDSSVVVQSVRCR